MHDARIAVPGVMGHLSEVASDHPGEEAVLHFQKISSLPQIDGAKRDQVSTGQLCSQ